jgi:hypothetical protein
MNWKDILEISGNIAAIIVGIIGVFFAIRENNRKVHVSINLIFQEHATNTQSPSGQPLKAFHHGINVDLINRQRLNIHISEFQIFVNGKLITDFPYVLFVSEFLEDNLLMPGRMRSAFFWSDKFFKQLDTSKRIRFFVKVIDETGRSFRSNTLRVTSSDLKHPR